jgi:hypothetical protein
MQILMNNFSSISFLQIELKKDQIHDFNKIVLKKHEKKQCKCLTNIFTFLRIYFLSNKKYSNYYLNIFHE